jgi:hypothetical protein
LLCSVVSKLFERLLYTRLAAWVDGNKSLSHVQGGFRPGFRTEDNVLMLAETLASRARRDKSTLLCFLDIMTAYDSVFRDQLFVSMDECGIRGRVWLLIRSCYIRKSVVASASVPPSLNCTIWTGGWHKLKARAAVRHLCEPPAGAARRDRCWRLHWNWH